MNETPLRKAFLDANVLYPALLRNILMRLALFDLYLPRWSHQVHDEWTNALLRDRPDLSRARIERTRSMMDAHIDDAVVAGFEARIDALTLPDHNDRHVLAAAIHCGANLIVTVNTRDFPAVAMAGLGIEAIHPDPFICGLVRENPDGVLAALSQLLEAYKNPPVTFAGLLEMMKRQGLTATADALCALTAARSAPSP